MKKRSSCGRYFIPCNNWHCQYCGPILALRWKAYIKRFLKHPYFHIVSIKQYRSYIREAVGKGVGKELVFFSILDVRSDTILVLTNLPVRNAEIAEGDQYDRLLDMFLKIESSSLMGKKKIRHSSGFGPKEKDFRI